MDKKINIHIGSGFDSSGVTEARKTLSDFRKKLMENQHLSFRELLSERPTRMEVVVTFMAVLEMMARGEVHITQGDTFAPIRIHMRQLREDGEDTVYMDEEESLPGSAE